MDFPMCAAVHMRGGAKDVVYAIIAPAANGEKSGGGAVYA
jgi:hypothetical protein